MYRIIAFLAVFISFQSLAYTELSGEFGYSKQVYGANRDSDVVSKTWSGSIAFYFFEYTGIEFNYSNDQETATDNSEFELTGTTISIVSNRNVVTTEVFGLGIRQALTGKKAFLRPLISLGYARQRVDDKSEYTFTDSFDDSRTTIPGSRTIYRKDSVFATFSLQIRITKGLALKGSVRSVFAAFEWSEARDNLRYTAGFTWVF